MRRDIGARGPTTEVTEVIGGMGEASIIVLKDLWIAWERRRERRRDLAARQARAWRRVTERLEGEPNRKNEALKRLRHAPKPEA